MRWDDIIGHKEAISILQRMVAADRMPHAMLLVGAAGIGKGLVAKTLSAAMLCQATDNKPCGLCPSCRKVDAGSHPDMLTFESNSESIKIEQMRELQIEATLSPVLGGRRIIVMEDAQRLTLPAANSLLKTLEEPSDSLLFILTSCSPQSLLTTIISRCQMVRMAPAPPEMLAAALVQDGHPRACAEVAARLSGGRIGRAMALLQPDGMAPRSKAIHILLRLPDINTLSGWNEVIALEGSAGDRIPEVIDQLVFLLRDILLIRRGCDCQLVFNSDIIDQLIEIAAVWSESGIYSAVKETLDTARALTGNANARLVVEALLFRLREYYAVS